MDGKSRILNSMNLSTSSDAMRSIVSWCRIVSSEDELLSTGRHQHPIYELHYIYEGELSFQFDDSLLVCRPGEYVFIPSGVMHCIEDTADFTRKLVLGFDIASDNDIIRETFSGAKQPVAKCETPTFYELTQALLHKFAASDLTTSVSIACIVHTLLLETVDSLSTNSTSRAKHLRESVDSQRIDQMLSFINENVFNHITIADVAKALNMSVRQTSRICRHLFSCSINQLIVQARIKQICSLLADAKHSIADIAEMTGFANPYSFSRHFSHYTGVTPSSYRRDYEIRR